MKICSSLLQIFLSLILGRGFRTLEFFWEALLLDRYRNSRAGGEKAYSPKSSVQNSVSQRLPAPAPGWPSRFLAQPLQSLLRERQSDHFRMQIRLSLPPQAPFRPRFGQIPQLQGHRHQSLTNGALSQRCALPRPSQTALTELHQTGTDCCH